MKHEQKVSPMSQQQQGGVPGARTIGSPRTQHEEEPRKTPRVNIDSVLRWSTVGLLVTVAVTAFGIAGSIGAEHEAKLAVRGEQVLTSRSIQERAEIGLEKLPDAATAKRWVIAANEAGATVTAAQNKFLANSGPLSMEGIPVSYQEPTGRTVTYTETERTALAEEARTAALDGLDRSLLSFFEVESTDEDGLNAASDWVVALPNLDGDTAALLGAQWSNPEVTWFTSKGSSRLLWELRGADGELLAWASADYDNATLKMSELRLSAVEPEGATL